MADNSILRINAFQGIDQSAGEYGANAATSPDALNFVCRYGALRTSRAPLAWKSPLPCRCSRLFQAFFGPERAELLACGGGHIFVLRENGWQILGSGFQSDEWQAVNYRHEADEWIILVNGVDEACYWDGTSDTLGALNASQGGEKLIFSQITLLYERLWGAVYADTPDRIYWSESFAPDDWEIRYDTAGTGGGFADVATFDGSRIRAITAAFDDVLIFKDKSVHRLNGTYPGEFSLTQAYGSAGTLAPRTIVRTADRLYFLSCEGLCVYDGMTVSSLAARGDRRLRDIWPRVNQAAIEKACAALCGDVLYLSVPLDGATENTHVIEYGLMDGACSLTACGEITDFLVWRDGQEEHLVCLVGNQVCLYDEDDSALVDAVWNSPILSLGTLVSRKRTGRLYLTVHAHSLEKGRRPRMRLTLISGDRTRVREIPLKDGLNEVRKRVTLRGRTFRFRIENMDGAPLALNRGMELTLEEEFDG